MSFHSSVLPTTVCGIKFLNPVLTASGTFGYGIEFEKLLDLNALGGIVVKGLSREPIRGNPAPRLWEAVVLGGPHLVLTDIGRDNRVATCRLM